MRQCIQKIYERRDTSSNEEYSKLKLDEFAYFQQRRSYLTEAYEKAQTEEVVTTFDLLRYS